MKNLWKVFFFFFFFFFFGGGVWGHHKTELFFRAGEGDVISTYLVLLFYFRKAKVQNRNMYNYGLPMYK